MAQALPTAQTVCSQQNRSLATFCQRAGQPATARAAAWMGPCHSPVFSLSSHAILKAAYNAPLFTALADTWLWLAITSRGEGGREAREEDGKRGGEEKREREAREEDDREMEGERGKIESLNSFLLMPLEFETASSW